MGMTDLIRFQLRPPDSRLLPFPDRATAGARLAERLESYKGKDVLVLGVPRGGVPIAYEVATALDAELDVIVARKLGAPYQPELAIGAITADGTCHLDRDIVTQLQVGNDYIERATRQERAEARRREERFRVGRPEPRIAGRTVIVVDDGLATGATMFAAVDAIRRQGPARLVVAVPVGSEQACTELGDLADEVVCLARPKPFYAVGLYYERFDQTPDEEVVRLLEAARRRGRAD